MAEHQKIHPVNVEAPPPTSPLVPRELVGSEKGDPDGPAHTQVEQFPPHRRTLPVRHARPPRKKNSCCKCLCWSLCTLLLFIILLVATVGILYLVFQPKVPKYTVDRLRITEFSVDTNFAISTGFTVTITASNPNAKIGIYYEDGSQLSVWYTNVNLCSGILPVFYQGHRNTTVLTVILRGETQIGSNLFMALQTQQQTGMVPLTFQGDVPVRVKFGSLKLWKVRFLVSCDLVVNSLSVNNQISIRTSHCRFKLRL